VIAVDTNILVYSKLIRSEFHTAARDLLQSPSLRLLSETPRHIEVLANLVRDSRITSSTAHDAHIAALCIEHGIDAIFTNDRDFARFPLKVTNPFRP